MSNKSVGDYRCKRIEVLSAIVVSAAKPFARRLGRMRFGKSAVAAPVPKGVRLLVGRHRLVGADWQGSAAVAKTNVMRSAVCFGQLVERMPTAQF